MLRHANRHQPKSWTLGVLLSSVVPEGMDVLGVEADAKQAADFPTQRQRQRTLFVGIADLKMIRTGQNEGSYDKRTNRRDSPCRLFSGRGKLLFAGYAFSLFDGHDLARGNPREIFAFAVRPAYRYFGRGGFSQTEVHPEVALRDEGTTAADLVNLLVIARG